MTTAAVVEQEEGQIVVFQLDDESYGLDIFHVNEIINMRDITPLPRTRPYFLGLVNLRGKTIPVLDLRVRFGLTSSKGLEESQIIVLASEDGPVGIVVDQVSEVLTLQDDQIENPPALVGSATTQFVRGVAKTDGRLITLLDLEKTLERE